MIWTAVKGCYLDSTQWCIVCFDGSPFYLISAAALETVCSICWHPVSPPLSLSLPSRIVWFDNVNLELWQWYRQVRLACHALKIINAWTWRICTLDGSSAAAHMDSSMDVEWKSVAQRTSSSRLFIEEHVASMKGMTLLTRWHHLGCAYQSLIQLISYTVNSRLLRLTSVDKLLSLP